MDIRKVRKLIELLEESKVSEIEIKENDESIRISRHLPHQLLPQPQLQPQHFVAAPPPPPVIAAPPMPEPVAPAATNTEDLHHVIKSPMVGIFYAATAPGEPEFATVGQRVSTGDILCIIEAMKMMNQIEADVSGTIRKVLVDNGQPVEFGQPLFTLEI